jgi:hypothetical protein
MISVFTVQSAAVRIFRQKCLDENLRFRLSRNACALLGMILVERGFSRFRAFCSVFLGDREWIERPHISIFYDWYKIDWFVSGRRMKISAHMVHLFDREYFG